MSQIHVRRAAVAGAFYPDNAQELRSVIEGYLQATNNTNRKPKAIIVPHAGYAYSGPVAASAYARFLGERGVNRVVLLGPSHRVGFYGLATTMAEAYETPLGCVPLETSTLRDLETMPQVQCLDRAHEQEHSLEVQVPFLQTVLPSFYLIPLVVGEALASEVGEVLEKVWGGPETLVVISADLSHYNEYAEAKKMDEAFCHAIESLDPTGFAHQHTCGFNPVRGLLYMARKKKLNVETIDLRNSGDTMGPRRGPVVGYGAWGFYETS